VEISYQTPKCLWAKEILRAISKYFGMNKNEKCQKLWDAGKAVLRGKFIALNTYIRKEERSQFSNLTFHIKILEKEQTNPKESRRKEEINIKWN